MIARPTELQAEQSYFDAAEQHWNSWLSEMRTLAAAGADKQAARALKKLGKEQIAAFTDSTAVAVGRIDLEDGETLYIGRHLIKDEQGEVLVVNWQAGAAIPYHRASLDKPHGLTRKRTFRCEANRILDFADVLYGTGGADDIDVALLAELGRRRDGALRDIVATIQAAQYELIRAPLDQLLIVEGGPGTGKTEIALHRVSWLLFHNSGLRAEDFLVIGPNPAFMRYISKVLPALGDADVPLRDIGQLAPEVTRGRTEPAAVARLKGDARMADVLARGLDARIGVPEAAERLLVGTRYVTLPGPDVADLISAGRAASGGYAEQRRLFRDRLRQALTDRLGADPGTVPALDNLVERLWPQLTAASFLRDLFHSRNRLANAAAGVLTGEEVALLHRRAAERLSREIWSAADLALLDEAEDLINGTRPQYAHIVVDEVQDLSPMQLRSIARRSRGGSMTIVGDLAQATGPWAADGWADITRHLPDTLPVAVHPLRFGYRVPEQIMAFAGRLLPRAAAGATPPEAIQVGPADPVVRQVDRAERAGHVAAAVQAYASAGRYVGVICPARCRREVEEALTANGIAWGTEDVVLTGPREAKGLEFDAVVVVEPADIVAEDERGHRMLYIAYTRATQELTVVCVGDPLALGTEPSTPDGPDPKIDVSGHQVARLAEYLADRVRKSVPEEQWDRVLAMLRKRLER